MKFAVEPASADQVVPPHPIEGPMPLEGANWIADQYTLRLILDGVIRRVEGPSAEQGEAQMIGGEPAEGLSTDTSVLPPAGDEENTAGVSGVHTPAPGTVASVPFMITNAVRKRLRALGKTDAEIAEMKPEEAQAFLATHHAPASGEAQEH